MERLRPQPRRRRSVSQRTQRFISAAWIVASLALPAAGAVIVASGGLSAPIESALTHTVQAGESLSLIAKRYGTTVDEIMHVNGLNDPNLIYIGQVLTIPQTQQAAPQVQAGGQIYTVQRGDTLSRIASRFGVSVDDLAVLNNLANPNAIAVGLQLTIPGSTVQEVSLQPDAVIPDASYTLQRGDSLYRVSLIYGVSVDDLLAANNLATPNSIYPGLVVRVPSGDMLSVASADDKTSPERTTSTYTVRAGDTLARIAIEYDVTVDGIVAANGLLTADRIYAGQTLTLPSAGANARPAPAQAATAHVVQSGETLSEIAMRYGVTLHSMVTANQLSDASRIYIGMVLSIPSAQVGTNSVSYASIGSGACEIGGADNGLTGTGYFIRPVRGYRITQNFHSWHPGIDLALPTGNDVYASDGGTVVYSGWNPVGYGNLIILDHGNGWRTYYAHLSAIDVTCGDWVARGTVMGEVGSTGNSTGPHLHFEMLRFGVAVNPVGYIRF